MFLITIKKRKFLVGAIERYIWKYNSMNGLVQLEIEGILGLVHLFGQFPRRQGAFLDLLVTFAYHGAAVAACLECARSQPKNKINSHAGFTKNRFAAVDYPIFAYQKYAL